MSSDSSGDAPPPPAHKRRPRYRGKNPRRFEEKYKEHNPGQYPEEVAKVIASGKTPAGQHLPIMVAEVLECLRPRPGDRAIDCTLGYGGHTRELWRAIQPGGHLLSLDADPIEIARTESRLRAAGMDADAWTVRRCNFAGLLKALADQNWTDGADVIFADLGLSSMQIDNPARGFTFKQDGPLDMRMNPHKGRSAAALLAAVSSEELQRLLEENADEPQAALLARSLSSGPPVTTTRELAEAVRRALPARLTKDESDLTVRRVFQALRIAVNDEFAALESLLRALPTCLRPGGRVAILSFHSGEDRRVKKALQDGHRTGLYSAISGEIIRPTAEEQRLNPRSSPAKLRWAVRG
jgi:16S rRNA (cytosine1402-N4)-methyltransferase